MNMPCHITDEIPYEYIDDDYSMADESNDEFYAEMARESEDADQMEAAHG